MSTALPLVAHLVYRLDFGGLETLLVDCINRMPAHRYRHAVICLTDYTSFAEKITKPDVALFALHKPAGLGLAAHAELYRLLKRLRPAILHTYNLAAVEYAPVAALAGVPVRIHAEHGRDAADPEGKNRKHNFLRRLASPFIHRFVPVSKDLAHWLAGEVGIAAHKIEMIHNGVDTERFRPASAQEPKQALLPFPADSIVIGTVGRVQEVKDQQCLVDAFIRLRGMACTTHLNLRLAIVGDGPLLPALKEKVRAAGIEDAVWLPGARADVHDIMRQFSIFALPSIAEGTPVTILEAMASGLPVVATRVGGVPEVVKQDVTGKLVAPRDPAALAEALAAYCADPQLAAKHGQAGRMSVEQKNSTAAMTQAYLGLYDSLYARVAHTRKPIESCAE
jgi:sugar transferase (PEP-CTERM/EpsH1 system associated)